MANKFKFIIKDKNNVEHVFDVSFVCNESNEGIKYRVYKGKAPGFPIQYFRLREDGSDLEILSPWGLYSNDIEKALSLIPRVKSTFPRPKGIFL